MGRSCTCGDAEELQRKGTEWKGLVSLENSLNGEGGCCVCMLIAKCVCRGFGIIRDKRGKVG